MLICWQGKKQTAIHNHEKSSGWVLCLEGSLEEIQYENHQSLEGKTLFKKKCVKNLKKGYLSYIDDSLAWHSISHSNSQRSVTLHLYVPPIYSCYIYNDKKLNKKIMSYDQNFMSSFKKKSKNKFGYSSPL